MERLTKEVGRLAEEHASHAPNGREDVLRLETTYKEQLAQAEQRESDLRSEIAPLEADRRRLLLVVSSTRLLLVDDCC